LPEEGYTIQCKYQKTGQANTLHMLNRLKHLTENNGSEIFFTL